MDSSLPNMGPKREPYYVFSIGKGVVFWVFIIVIIILVLLCIFNRCPDEKFVGFTSMHKGQKYSEYMDTDTRDMLGLHDPSSDRNETKISLRKSSLRENNSHRSNSNIINDYASSLIEDSVEETEEIEDSVEEVEKTGEYPVTPRYEDLDLYSKEELKKLKMSVGEDICREFLEKYYGKPFNKVTPDFLKNPITKRNLELDGYNEELKIAFEYNGEQHYKFPHHFHPDEDAFRKQIARDNFKIETCNKLGIYLINIRYDIPPREIPEFLKTNLPKK